MYIYIYIYINIIYRYISGSAFMCQTSRTTVGALRLGLHTIFVHSKACFTSQLS